MKIDLNRWQRRDILDALEIAIEGEEEALEDFGSGRGWKTKIRRLKEKIDRYKRLRKYLKYL